MIPQHLTRMTTHIWDRVEMKRSHLKAEVRDKRAVSRTFLARYWSRDGGGVRNFMQALFNVVNGNYEQNSQCKAIWTINLLYHDPSLWRKFEVTWAKEVSLHHMSGTSDCQTNSDSSVVLTHLALCDVSTIAVLCSQRPPAVTLKEGLFF